MISIIKEILGFLLIFAIILFLIPLNMFMSIVHTISVSAPLLFSSNADRLIAINKGGEDD